MTYKQIEATREVRLWITQIAVPIATTAIAAGIATPEVRQAVVNKCKSVKNSVTKMLVKKEKKAKANLENSVSVVYHIHTSPDTGEYRMYKETNHEKA